MVDFAWPAKPCPTGVYAYDHIAYGDLSGWEPAKLIAARRTKNIGTLRQDYSLTPEDQRDGHGIITDLFLTKTANDHTTRVCEIIVSHHTPPHTVEWLKGGQKIGSWINVAGLLWTVTRMSGPVLGIVPAAPALSGSLDLRDLLRWPSYNGALTGDEIYNGYGLGVEPKQFGGRVTINSLAVSYSSPLRITLSASKTNVAKG